MESFRLTDKQKENFIRKFRIPETNKLRPLTALELFDLWKYYDTEGNGYFDGENLDRFLMDLMTSLKSNDNEQLMVTMKTFDDFKQTFMNAYDDNRNNKIEMKELIQIIPIEETLSYLLLHDNHFKTSFDFMRIWRKYDKDNSGYIETDELKNLLKDFYRLCNRKAIPKEKLDEYSDVILAMFDSNKDGKLQISEFSKMLPVEENYLKQIQLLGNVNNRTVSRIFSKYDSDQNGYIDMNELQLFLKDLLDCEQKEYNTKTIDDLKELILKTCDTDDDKQLRKDELKRVLTVLGQQNARLDKRRNIFTCCTCC